MPLINWHYILITELKISHISKKKLISVWPAKNLIQYLWDELEHKTGPEATSVLVEGLEPEEWRLKQQDINLIAFYQLRWVMCSGVTNISFGILTLLIFFKKRRSIYDLKNKETTLLYSNH